MTAIAVGLGTLLAAVMKVLVARRVNKEDREEMEKCQNKTVQVNDEKLNSGTLIVLMPVLCNIISQAK